MNSRDTLFTELGVFADFSPEVREAYRRAEVVFAANIVPQLQQNVLRQTERGAPARLRALDTMNLWIETTRDSLLEAMRQVEIVVIAEGEGRQLAGTTGLR